MRRRLILIAATWAAVVGLVAGSAHAQSPTPPDGQFVLVGVVVLEGGSGLAFVQEPNFTNNKVVTVRLGDSVGPYRVTKILTHQVELTGPGGTVSVPLAGVPGAVSVASSAGASSAGTSSPGTSSPGTGQLSPPAARDSADGSDTSIPRGDPRRQFQASQLFIGAGATVSALAPPLSVPPPPAPPLSVPPPRSGSASMQTPGGTLSPPAAGNSAGGSDINIPRGDPRRRFNPATLFIGAR